MLPDLAQRVKLVPSKPGVYIFRDATGHVLYVGKASRLRERLRAYTSATSLPSKYQRMLSKATDFEILVTASEQEALILECNLIKKHRPPYNARLKDDKSYPYIKIDLNEDFPLVYITRRVNPDGARYFGPFASAGSVRKTLDLLKKLFPYRSCTKTISGKDSRPCLDYYLHRCLGPCIGAVSREEYREVIQQVILFLEGRVERVVRELKDRMEQAAARLEFERAAVIRDQIQAIKRMVEEQKAVSLAEEDEDVIAVAKGRETARVEVFFVRSGKIVGREHFTMEGVQDEGPETILTQFVKQFYGSASYIPPRIILQHPVEDSRIIQEWLTGKRGGKVLLRVPKRGQKYKLVQMVAQNAREGLHQLQARELLAADALEQALSELQEALNLPRLPRRIECYDISNLQGTDAVGSMVVFEEGKPKPAHYRRFRIKGVEGVDDYAMMQEVLRRRFRRLAEVMGKEGGDSEKSPPTRDGWGLVPDLVLIDGGKGHLSVALQVFLELGITCVSLASIAKEEETIFVPHTPEPIILPPNSQALFLVQRVRDEAHRFAVAYHRRLRTRRTLTSPLDKVPGIGPKRKRLLLRRFGSIKALKEAPLEELAAIPGMTLRLARQLKEYL